MHDTLQIKVQSHPGDTERREIKISAPAASEALCVRRDFVTDCLKCVLYLLRAARALLIRNTIRKN
jgi:hypothetical protein